MLADKTWQRKRNSSTAKKCGVGNGGAARPVVESAHGGFMATIQEKTARLAAAQQKVDAFIAAGGDLKSPAAAPIGLEFVHAFADVAKEFGYEILKPINEPDSQLKPKRKIELE